MISGIRIPDSKIAREAAELVRQHESEMLFNHSVRVFLFGAMKGIRQHLKFDSELLFVAALFHDFGSGMPWLLRNSRAASAPSTSNRFVPV
jgi:HD superfamily phosphohydrolase YqeK